jgi:hypothetical protein
MAYESNRSEGRSSSGRPSRPSSGRPSSGRPSSSRSSSSRPSPGRSSEGRSTTGRSTEGRSYGSRSESPRSSGRDAGSRGSYDRTSSRPSSPRSSGSRDAGRGSRRSDEFRSPRSNDSRPRRDDAPRGDRRSDAPRSDRRSDSRADSRPRRDDVPRGERRSDAPRSDRRSDSRSDARPRRDDARSDSRPRRDDAPRGERRSDSRPSRDGARTRPAGKPDVRGGRERNEDRFDSTEFVAVDRDIDIKILPRQVVAELRNISPAAADFVSKHLAAAMYALEDDDAERAYQHAIAARSRAARLGCVREMVGTSAYYAGKWAEALSEFRTFQRLTGDPGFLPLMADCERGLGRPLRALQIARSSQVNSLDAATRIELRIVASGARRDLGQFEAAVATLECPELQSRGHGEAVVRLKYAYADALLALGEREKARDWFVKTALADVDDLTDAADRAVLISE